VIDQLVISAAGFGGGLVAGLNPATVFGSSDNADFGSDAERFHFDTSTSTLYFDADGDADVSAVVAIAQFTNNVSLQSGDFWMV
jgi:Ca2+-binding RTX toxin-like protein